jgi:two-component system response regulator FixJ
MPAKAAAAALDLSVRAIELHRANLLRKLDARGQSDLIRIAFAAGLGAKVA